MFAPINSLSLSLSLLYLLITSHCERIVFELPYLLCRSFAVFTWLIVYVGSFS